MTPLWHCTGNTDIAQVVRQLILHDGWFHGKNIIFVLHKDIYDTPLSLYTQHTQSIGRQSVDPA